MQFYLFFMRQWERGIGCSIPAPNMIQPLGNQRERLNMTVYKQGLQTESMPVWSRGWYAEDNTAHDAEDDAGYCEQ